MIVQEENCLTYEGLTFDDLFKKYNIELSLEDRVTGRLLAKPLITAKKSLLIPINTELDKQ